MQAGKGRKEQGSNMQFHEMLAMLWLQYLHNIGLHDNTFDIAKTRPRIDQFRALIKHDYEMEYNAPQGSFVLTPADASKIEMADVS